MDSVSEKELNSALSTNLTGSDSVSEVFVFPVIPRSKFLGEAEREQDSLSVRKAKTDLLEVKKLINVSPEQEEVLISVFFDRYEYLKVPHTSTGRTQLVFNALYKRLEQTLDAEQIQSLEEAGLIKLWFKTEE
ncbi:hypothetical protein ACFSKL_21315 [Belliella marina]|uniref:Uncharacterized protein n=1 Tax=Belliella marina TaxID=1644146 RepID=A0ABW4VUD0_9BACT